ncbi:methyltransferase domain-containing protein [candidate division KSB1 bacterium]|nr:methyltransferase domain-containing protein [candidate division KSB1 bacterium]
MEEMKRQHNRKVWEQFWTQKRELDKVYSNSDRVISQIEQLGPLQGKRVLEVGAGTGRDGFKLVDCGAVVVLLDYAKNSLEIMQQLSWQTQKPVYLVQGNAFQLPFRDQVIDVVFHQGLLEHFRNPENILEENYRVLKQNGFAIADVPQRYHIYTVVKHILIRLGKWFAGWETEFSRSQLESMFRRSGFSIYSVYGDWMRPSFFYRSLREALKKTGIQLPLYPGKIAGWSKIRNKLRRVLKKSSLSYYTFMDIGVIGRK